MRYYKSVFISIVIFVSALVYAAIKTNQWLQQKYLYQSSLKETLITLDDTSFNNEDLFHRASLIAAKNIFKEKTLLISQEPIEGFTLHSQDRLFYTHGSDVVEYGLKTKEEKIFNLKFSQSEKLRALAPHPFDETSLLGVSSLNSLYNINTHETEISPTLIEKNIFPDNVVVKALWVNPISKNITFLTNIENNTVLSERSSTDWLKNIKEITLRKIHYTGGLDLSLHHKALITQNGGLHIINWEEGEMIHVYKHNKKALFSTHKNLSLGFENRNFLLLSNNEISYLKWKKRNDLIVMNHTLKVNETDKLKLEWKFFSKYYGAPRFFLDLELKKDAQHTTSILGVGPLYTPILEIPFAKPLSNMKEAHIHPWAQNTSLHSFLSQNKELVVKIAAIDRKGKGIGSVQNFKIEPHNIRKERARVPASIQEIFIKE